MKKSRVTFLLFLVFAAWLMVALSLLMGSRAPLVPDVRSDEIVLSRFINEVIVCDSLKAAGAVTDTIKHVGFSQRANVNTINSVTAQYKVVSIASDTITVALQASLDSANWFTIGAIDTVTANDTYYITDTEASSKRYYRFIFMTEGSDTAIIISKFLFGG